MKTHSPTREARTLRPPHDAKAESLANLRRDTEDGLPSEPSCQATRRAHALGWFSIGLGLAKVLAPRAVARVIGLGDDHPHLIPLTGLREIATGYGILSSNSPAPWLWMRVVGDAVDLALLGAARSDADARLGCLARTTAAVAMVTAIDVTTAVQNARGE